MRSISVARSDAMQGKGRFFDGQTATQHSVGIRLSANRQAIEITGETLAGALSWPLPDLRATQDHATSDQIVLTRHAETDDETPRDPARLIIDDPEMIDWLRRTRPNLNRRDVQAGTGKRVLRNLGLALGSVALMLFVILPAMANTLAGLIPLEREIAFGKSVTGQMETFLGGSELGALHCEAAEGRAALDRLTERLVAGRDLGYDLNVQVFDHPMVNAFAAPGGQVVLLRGLIEKASGPDAVAAVLAHEIGHVVARDPTRAALRTVGSAGLLSLLIGDVTGGAIAVALAEQAMNSSYSREAERAADGFALESLTAAEISAEGMARFFDDISDLQGEPFIPEAFASHPDTEGRAARARNHARTQAEVAPAMSDTDWTALKSICTS